MYEISILEFFLWVIVYGLTCIGLLYLYSKIPDTFLNPEAHQARKEGKKYYFDKQGNKRDVNHGYRLRYESAAGGNDIGIYYYAEGCYGLYWDAQQDKLDRMNSKLPEDCPYRYEFAYSKGGGIPYNRYIMKFDKERKLPCKVDLVQVDGFIRIYYDPNDCTGRSTETQKITREEAFKWGFTRKY